eukprot:477139_1
MTWDHLTRSELLVNLVIVSCFVFLCTIIWYTLIFQLFCANNIQLKISKQKEPTHIISKMLLFWCVTLSTLSTWSDLSRLAICYIFNKNLYSFKINQVMAFADFFCYCASILFYLIAISRLQISFRNTNYTINTYVLSFFYVLITISFILAIYYTITICLAPSNQAHSFWVTFDTIPLIAICIIDFTLNTSLLILFISKLKQLLSVTLAKYNLPHRLTSDLLLLITRHTILFTLVIITNQIWFIIILLRTYVIPQDIDFHASDFTFRVFGN